MNLVLIIVMDNNLHINNLENISHNNSEISSINTNCIDSINNGNNVNNIDFSNNNVTRDFNSHSNNPSWWTKKIYINIGNREWNMIFVNASWNLILLLTFHSWSSLLNIIIMFVLFVHFKFLFNRYSRTIK